MGKPAARLGDSTMHGSPLMGAPATTVLIGGKPAWRMGDQHTCPIPNAPPPAGTGTPHGPGTTTVIPDGPNLCLIQGKAAARVGDIVNEPGANVPLPPPNTIVVGCPTVLISTMPGGGGGGGGDGGGYCKGDPVNVFNGSVVDQYIDFELDNYIAISMTRSYNSTQATKKGPFGFGWIHSLHFVLTEVPDGLLLTEGFISTPLEKPTRKGDPSILGDRGCAIFCIDRGYRIYFKQLALWFIFDTFDPDEKGLLLSGIEDLLGNKLSLTYDRQGNLTKVSDPNGRTLLLQYDHHERIFQLFLTAVGLNHPKLWKEYQYDNKGNLSAVRDALGNTFHYDYQDHLMVRKKLPSGYEVFWQYDNRRWCVRTWTSDGRYSYEFQYHPDHLTSICSTSGHQEIVQLDDNGVFLHTFDQFGTIERVEVNSVTGRVVSKYIGERVEEEEVFTDGRVQLLIDGEGRSEIPEYDEAGLVTAIHTASGKIWKYEVDQRDSILKISSPEGRHVYYDYDERGRQVRVEYPDGTWEELKWDNANNLVAIYESTGAKSYFQYDKFGNLISETWPDGQKIAYMLDDLFRVIEEKCPDGTWTRYRYNELGSVSFIEYSSQLKTSFERTGIGEITAIRSISPEGSLIQECVFDLDLDGRLQSIKTKEGETRLQRDMRGRIIELKRCDGYTYKFDYNDAGDILRITTPLCFCIFEYDGSGLVESITYNDDTTIVAERNEEGELVALEKEHDGQRIEVVRDGEGNVVADKTEAGHVSYPLTLGHNVESVTVDEEDFASFEWSGNTLTGVNAFGKRIALSLGADGSSTEFRFPNGVVQRQEFSESGLLRRQKVTDGNGNPIYDLSYQYNNDNRISTVDGTETRHYVYDAAGRITHVDCGNGIEESYSYHPGGNLTGSPWGGVHQLDDKGRVVRTNRESLICDEAGRIVQRSSVEGIVCYEYDYADQLSKVILADGQEITFQYDLIGRRIEKRTGDAVIRYTWAGRTMVRERHFDANGIDLQKEIRFVYLAGFPLPMARQDFDYAGNNGNATVRNYYYHLDYRGVPRAVTDEGGHTVWTGKCATWRGVGETTGDFYQPFRFEGHYCDEETGLHYVLTRYYDPTLGRFLTPNTEDELDGSGGVAYCVGDPINLVDPTGDTPVPGSLGWINGQLRSTIQGLVQTGVKAGKAGAGLGNHVDKGMKNAIGQLNKQLAQMGSSKRVMHEATRVKPWDPKNPKQGWGRGPKPYSPDVKRADALIVQVACDFSKETPTYKDAQKGAVQKVHRSYDWSVGKQASGTTKKQYADMFTQGSKRSAIMWDVTNKTFKKFLKGAGVLT